MSLDELRNEARFYMYDDDDDHMSLFEAFVCHTSKDLGPIDKDWFSKERDSQISDCSDFRSSGSVSSDQCTPVASPCLSRDKDGTPKSTVRTPASASTCQLNNSLLEWTPLLPSPPATKVFKTPDVPKTFSQSLGVNLATPSPLWSPSLETPPNKSKCKQDGKVLAPRNLFHLPGKNQQSVSSEGEDVLEDEEFKDVLSDREENPSLVSQSPKEKSLPVIVSNKYIGTAPAHQPCIEASSDTSGLALRHSSSSTDYNLLKPRAEGCLSRGDVQLFNGSTNMRKDECFMSTDEVACKKAQLTAVATHSPASKMDSTTFSYPVLCQTSSCFRPPPRKQNITALTILAMPSTVTMLNSPAVMHSSSHSDPSDGSSKDFSFSEDKSDSGRPDLSLTQMFEVAESTIACIEATDVGFTQCISSGSEAQSGHGIDNTGSEGSSQRPEEKQASVMQQLPAHTDICHSNSPAPFKKEIEVSQSLGITGKHVGADVAAGGCMISTGFKTGSGKPVVVLESSLAAAKGKLSIFDQAFRETEGAEKQSTDYESSTVVHDGSRSLESMAELDSVGNGVASLVEAPKYGKNCTMQSHKKADVHHSGCAKNECQTAHDCIKEEPDEAVSDKGTQDSSSVVFGSSRALKTQSSRTLPCQSTFTSGFTTATGKPVYIQEENLNHARQLFSEPSPKGCSEKLQGNTVPPVLLTDAEEMTTDSTYKLVKQKTLPATVKAGFMTAGGQPVYIQAAALSRAQRVLSKVSAEVIQADLKDESTGKAVNISVNSLMKSGQHDNSPFTSGFMTAGGKPVYIQEEGLSHARQLFSEANREVSCVEWTVNGVPAQPTTDAAKLKTLVNSLEKPEVQPGTVVSGFMTAGGKPVYVQEEALNHAHHAFMKGAAETSQISVQSVTVPTSFTTGAGKIVNVSVDSLVKSKERHDSFTSGFTPAEGKAVCIQEGQKVSTGFMTGSGKMVSVSKSSLVNAKNMLSAGCADTPSLGHCTSERDAASPDPGQGIENGGEGVQRPSVENYTPSGSSIEVRQKALESRQEALKEESKYNTPTNPLAVHTSDRRTPASGLSRLGLVGSPMFSSKLKPAVKTPNFVTPFKAVSSSKAQTPLTASKAAAGPRTLFQKKAIQPGKLWILRKVTKAPRLSLRDALRGQCPKLYTLEELRSYGVLDSTALVNSENAANFVFHISSSDGLVILGDGATMQLASTEVTLGRDEFCLAFLGMPGVDKNLVAPGWVDNHYRWIVWKLASMELHCPEVFGGRTLTPDQVMFQLKYRYDIEIDNSCRSALRKIYEKDDVPSKTLVLCVSDVVCREDGRVHLELTDGWYSIRAELDEPLSNLVSTQRIFVGLKLIMSGAELVGASEACAPLEAPKEAALKISYNSTRRARWDARLGYFAVPRPFRVPLASLHPKGGLVGKVDCLVIRAYPVMYLEMLPNGMGVMRREKEEMAVAAKHEKLRTAFIEKLTAEVLSQVEKSDSEELPLSGVRMAFSVKQIQGLNSGRDIWKAIRNSSDPSEIERLLTEEQLRLLRHFQEQQLCLRQTNIQQKLESALQAATEENKCPKDRVVIPVLKVLLGGIHEADLRKNICCLISVWRPTDDTREMLKQGKALSIYNVNVTTPRKVLPDVQNSAVELSTTKMTQLEPANCPDHIRIYYMRQVTSFPVLLTESGSQGRAVDIVGLVLRISQQKEGTVLTLTDSKLNFIQLVLDKKAVALEGNIQKGEFLSATDVTLRQGSTDRLATLETTEFSAVTTSPAAGDLQRALSALKATIQDPPGFIAAALAKLQAPVHVISPRLPTSHCSPLLPTKLAPVVTPTGTTMRMAAVASGTPVKPKRSDISDSDGLLLPKRKVQVEPGSPAEALSKQVRSRIAILERYTALEPIPLLATPQSTKAKMPFRSLGTPTVKGCPIADSVEDSPQMDLD